VAQLSYSNEQQASSNFDTPYNALSYTRPSLANAYAVDTSIRDAYSQSTQHASGYEGQRASPYEAQDASPHEAQHASGYEGRHDGPRLPGNFDEPSQSPQPQSSNMDQISSRVPIPHNRLPTESTEQEQNNAISKQKNASNGHAKRQIDPATTSISKKPKTTKSKTATATTEDDVAREDAALPPIVCIHIPSTTDMLIPTIETTILIPLDRRRTPQTLTRRRSERGHKVPSRPHSGAEGVDATTEQCGHTDVQSNYQHPFKSELAHSVQREDGQPRLQSFVPGRNHLLRSLQDCHNRGA
jgi:hypothetical protein